MFAATFNTLMGVIKRQSLKSSVVNYAGVFLGLVFFIFVFPHILPTEYLGLMGLFQNITWVFVALPGAGLLHILYRYYHNWKDSPILPSFHAFALLGTALGSLLFLALFWLFREPIQSFYAAQSPLFIPYYLLAIPLVVIQAFILYFEMYCTMKLRVVVPGLIREVLNRVMLILWVFLFVAGVMGESLFVTGLAGIALLMLVLLIGYARFRLGFRLSSPALYWKQPDKKAHAAYGGSLFCLSSLFSIQNFVDGLLIPAYLGLEALGIYGRPLVLGQMIQVPMRSISLITQPILREAWIENDLAKISSLHKSISINLYLIGAYLFVLLLGNTDNIFRLLPEKFGGAREVLYLIAIGRLADMAFGLNNEILYSSKYYRFMVWATLFTVVCTVALNVLLLPRIGLAGPALAVSASLILFNVIKTLFIYQRFGFHGFSRHYIHITLIWMACLACMFFLPYWQILDHHRFINTLLNIGINSLLGSVLFLVPVVWLRISPDFNQFLKLGVQGRLFRGGHRMEDL